MGPVSSLLPACPGQEHSGTTHPFAHLYWTGCGVSKPNQGASVLLQPSHRHPPRSTPGDQVPAGRDHKVVGGGAALEPLVAAEGPTPVPRVLRPQPPAPSLQALPLLEQGGHVQQRILNVLPQPVGVLEGERGHVQGMNPGLGGRSGLGVWTRVLEEGGGGWFGWSHRFCA